MKHRSKSTILSLVALLGLMTTVVFSSPYRDDSQLKGLDSVQAVFDVRTGNVEMLPVLLNLIHNTYKSKEVAVVTEKPKFVLVFIGPVVKLVSTNRAGFQAKDHESLDAIASKISEMTKDGIQMEVCLAAAKLFKVDPATLLPEFKQEENGWVSLIGYQAKGYSLIPVY